MALAALVLLTLTLAPLPVSAAPDPGPAYYLQSYPPVTTTRSVAISDVTGDGGHDVLVTTGFDFDPPNDFKLLIFEQLEDGTLGPAAKLDTDSTSNSDPLGMTVADLNGDGDDDVAVATGPGIDIYYQSEGGLSPKDLVPTSSAAQYVEAGDKDADGDADLFVAAAGGILLLLNTGSGFEESSVTTTPQREIELGDANGDGRMDVVGFFSQTIHLYLQNGDGSFGDPVDYAMDSLPFVYGRALEVADVNADGLDDVVASMGSNDQSKIKVFAQNTGGTLDPPVVYNSYESPSPLEAGDLNLDGRFDIVTRHPSNEVGIYFQRPDGTLAGECRYEGAGNEFSSLQGLALGDTNADGQPDAAMSAGLYGMGVLRRSPLGQGTSSMALTASPFTIDPDEQVRISGVLTLEGGSCSRADQMVRVLHTPPGGIVDEATTTTNAQGAFSLDIVLSQPGMHTFRASWDGAGDFQGSSSPTINVQVRKRPSSLTLTRSRSILQYGQSVKITAHLDVAADASNREVVIYQRPYDEPKTILATGNVDANGDFSTTVAPAARTAYVAEFAGDDIYDASRSAEVEVQVHVVTTGRLSRHYKSVGGYKLYRRGVNPRYRGEVAPNHDGEFLAIRLERRRGGRWRYITSEEFVLDAQSKVVVVINAALLKRDVRYRVRATFSGDDDHLSDSAPWSYFRVP